MGIFSCFALPGVHFCPPVLLWGALPVLGRYKGSEAGQWHRGWAALDPRSRAEGCRKLPRGGGRRICAGAGTVPSCRHAWPPPCRHFPGQEAACPPRQGTRTGEGQAASPKGTRLSQHVRGMHSRLCRDPAGVQILGNLESGTRGLVGGADMAQLWLRMPGPAPAAGGQCWDRLWAVPRKFVQAGER